MAKTVVDLQWEIQALQSQIQEIQKQCEHPGYECVMYSYRIGSYYPTRLCTTCRYPLPGITPEEEQKAREWSQQSGSFAVQTNE